MTQGLASSLSKCAEFSPQDTRLSQHGEVLIVSHNSSDSGDLSQDITKQRARLGIMVFSSAGRVLYANEAAYYFLKVMNQRENGHTTHGALPISIAGLFDQILNSLENRITNHNQEQLEARRLLVGQAPAVLLQAFGLPDRLARQQTRIVITMEGTIRPFDAESSEPMPLST